MGMSVHQIPSDAGESRVAEAMVGLADDEAERPADRDPASAARFTAGGAWELDPGSQLSAAFVGVHRADDY
jgi:hypothetical protein